MLPMISSFERNRPDDAQAAALEHGDRLDARPVASCARHARQEIRAHVGREQRAVAREQPRVEDVLVDRRGAQRLGRRRGILECQRRGAVGADDVGEHGDVADQAGPAVDVVVGRKDGAGRHQRDPAGGHGGGRELARHRLAAEPGAEAIEHRRSRMILASPSSRELRRSPERSAASTLIAKRIRPSFEVELDDAARLVRSPCRR